MTTGDKTALQAGAITALLQMDGLNAIPQTAVAVCGRMQLTRGTSHMAQRDRPRARAKTGDSAGKLRGETLLHR